jgi:phosphoribosylpyrophosphate synthetase
VKWVYYTQVQFNVQGWREEYAHAPAWLVVPFGPYARQDQKRSTFDSVGCKVACQTLKHYFAGISTIEVHSSKALQIMKDTFGTNNVYNLDPTDLYIQDIQDKGLSNIVVVSPDSGANDRADALAKKLGAERFYSQTS